MPDQTGQGRREGALVIADAVAESGTLSLEDLNRLQKDNAPKKKPGRPKGSKAKQTAQAAAAALKAENEEIEKGLTELLVAPGLAHAAKMLQATGAGREPDPYDEWAAKHYETQAPRLAKEIVRQSEKFPLIRKLLVSGKEGLGVAGFVTAIAAYLYGPAMLAGYVPPVPIAAMILQVDLPPDMLPVESDGPLGTEDSGMDQGNGGAGLF